MKNNNLLTLFLTWLKIGAFTFGGGYAMIALLQREVVENKQWINNNDFLDLVAVSESTPGPIAVNMATYIGYRINKLPGSFVSTLGVCIPSLVIIYIISLFLDKFLALTVISYAFRGIQICVCYLILSAGIKMFREQQNNHNIFNLIITIMVISVMICCTLFSISFSSVFYILICGAIGIGAYLINRIKKRELKK